MDQYIMYTHKFDINSNCPRLIKIIEIKFEGCGKKIYYGHAFSRDLRVFLFNKFKQLPSAFIGSDSIKEFKIFEAPDEDSAILIYEMTKDELRR